MQRKANTVIFKIMSTIEKKKEKEHKLKGIKR